MKKHLPLISIAIIAVVAIGGVLWWNHNQPSINLDQAKSVAMEDAQTLVNNVDFSKAKLDRDNGRLVYEIDFKVGKSKYEYKIDAKTKRVVSKEVKEERVEPTPPATPKTPETPTTNPNTQSALIGEVKAKEIALKDANLKETNITRFQWKLDYEKGIQVYEIEFYHGLTEYDYDINATTGAIVKKEIDASRR
jgi:peptidase propeptide and YPEB domain protein